MVTKAEYISNGKYMSAEKFCGLSTDSKPVSCGNGSIFIEIDKVAERVKAMADHLVKMCKDFKSANYLYISYSL